MKHPYDPKAPDPLGIRAETERERLASPFRDRRSGIRVHPIQHDVDMLVDFVIARRRRSAPDVFAAARRVLRRVDTEALRFLVFTVLDDGRYSVDVHRRCKRILGYCETIEAALALKRRLYDSASD